MLEIKSELKVVVVTPAGRKRYLEVLVPQVAALRPIVDEYRLWVNTENQEDIKYMEALEKEYKGFIKLDRLKDGQQFENNLSIYYFFKNCCDPNTIYVRFDDDVVYIDKENFAKFVEFRFKHPEFYLVYGNILNNSVITYLHQKFGKLPLIKGMHAEYLCTGDNGWKSTEFAEGLHRIILKNSPENFRFPGVWILSEYERVSINCISWKGEGFDGNVGKDEEMWLSCDRPRELKRPNCIFGDFVCVHYAFHVQREKLDQTDILKQYKCISS